MNGSGGDDGPGGDLSRGFLGGGDGLQPIVSLASSREGNTIDLKHENLICTSKGTLSTSILTSVRRFEHHQPQVR
ncbi:unnamed protein product [Allacma fusca]|uniref:Uncharacterized protein n=1 Tax=Allacma fusca TaxID=39272 RepID=A0A8J2P4U4_9HEXA|nr:unnamed protein product [Allacma fusca]